MYAPILVRLLNFSSLETLARDSTNSAIEQGSRLGDASSDIILHSYTPSIVNSYSHVAQVAIMASSTRKILQVQELNVDPEGPPKPPRTAFMCFSDAKSKDISAKSDVRKKDIIKRVAEEWRALSNRERADWDEIARDDKLRYGREKSTYTGPWNIPKRRAKKHPLAPKRPMSAFLKYSQTRRSLVKQQNPDMSNTDVSRLLGEMWRSAPEREKRPYVETEERERAAYKQETAAFKAQQARVDAASRTPHAAIAAENSSSLATGMYMDAPNAYHDVGYRQNHGGYYQNTDIYRQAPNHAYQYDTRHRQATSLAHQPYPIHYGYSFSQAASFDSFVDSIPPPPLAGRDVFDDSTHISDENSHQPSTMDRYS